MHAHSNTYGLVQLATYLGNGTWSVSTLVLLINALITISRKIPYRAFSNIWSHLWPSTNENYSSMTNYYLLARTVYKVHRLLIFCPFFGVKSLCFTLLTSFRRIYIYANRVANVHICKSGMANLNLAISTMITKLPNINLPDVWYDKTYSPHEAVRDVVAVVIGCK